MKSDDSRTRAVVVGGGLAGLAAAIELCGRGIDVSLVEVNAHLGGKMNTLEEGGFAFDMGPTLLTLPEVLCGIIRRANRRVSDLIDLVRLDPQWRCHFEDGVRLDLYENVARMAAHLDERLPGTNAGREWAEFVSYSRRMNRLSRRVFFYRDIGGIADVLRTTPIADSQLARDALAMRPHATYARTVRRYLREPHVQQLAEHFLQYVGSSPFLAPSILAMIASVQLDQGCWYAMGGTRQVARALERLLRDAGVECLLGTRVERILHEHGAVRGVRLSDGREIAADVVVSNADVRRTLRGLVGSALARAEQARILRRWSMACSGIVLYLGLERRYEHLAHHNFFFSRDGQQEFEDIYRRGIPARDPTLYVAAPSCSDATQAPPGGEALYILMHTPGVRNGTATASREGDLASGRAAILEKLARFGMADLERRIVVERALTPPDIERMYGSEEGAIYGLASHGRLIGGFKPRNSSSVLRGLYFAGGSVNPGPGVPMALMSGVTAASAVARDLGLPMIDPAATAEGPRAGEYRRLDALAGAACTSV
ncbi:MAG: phytoene desaturase [Proteobacteria bacterium]|nr:MAG: phytoene desaturase [Pseudomonadota bacterium]